MISVEDVITRLNTQSLTSTYSVKYAKIKEPILTDIIDLPIIYVGYLAIDSKNPSVPIEHDLFNQHGEDLVQTIEIQIVCEVLQFPTIWKNVYKSLIGWNPNLVELQHTGMTYSQGGVMGLENSRLWHLDRWKIGFPTVTVDL